MEGHELSIQSIIGFIMVWFIQKAKDSDRGIFKWISDGTATICRATSAILAMLVSGGVTWTVTSLGENGYDILIHAPHWSELAHFAVGAAFQFINQEVQYQSLIKPSLAKKEN